MNVVMEMSTFTENDPTVVKHTRKVGLHPGDCIRLLVTYADGKHPRDKLCIVCSDDGNLYEAPVFDKLIEST